MEDSQKVYAYIYLKLLNYTPLKDIFSEAEKLIEPLERRGYCQLVSCRLHPVMTRRFMRNDGRFYANYRTAFTPFMVNAKRPIVSDLSLDVNLHAYSDAYTHPDINQGRSFELKIPFHGNTPLKPILLHFAFEEVKFKTNRGADDYREDKRSLPMRTQRIRRSLIPPVELPRRRVTIVESDDDEDISSVSDVVEEIEPIRTIYRRLEPVTVPPPHTVVRQSNVYIPKSTYNPILQQQSPGSVVSDSSRSTDSHTMVPYSPPPRVYEQQQFVQQPAVQMRSNLPLGSHTVDMTVGLAIASYGLVRPLTPFSRMKDFGLWTKADSDIINSMIAGHGVITNMPYMQRCKSHDALCVVWNSVYVMRTSIDSKLSDWILNKRGPTLFDSQKKKLKSELVRHDKMLASLEVLEESFRSYEHYVVPYSRPL
jgi:hypothetical protein